MLSSRLQTIAVGLVVLLTTAVVQAQKTDLEKFAGPWSVTAARLGEKDAQQLIGAAFLFEGKVAKFTQAGDNGKLVTDVHPIKMDPKTNRIILYQQQEANDPDADPTAGAQRGIYSFKDGALFLCLTAPDAKAFPKKFVSKAGETVYLLLRLERPKTAAAPSPVKKN